MIMDTGPEVFRAGSDFGRSVEIVDKSSIYDLGNAVYPQKKMTSSGFPCRLWVTSAASITTTCWLK